MWVDTHVHFDAVEFEGRCSVLWGRAQALGVAVQVIPSVSPANFDAVRGLARAHAGSFYALGIHPLFVMGLDRVGALALLRAQVVASLDDPCFVGVGEIGLDGFVSGVDWETQVWFFRAQLLLAREFGLPVLLHVRRSVDVVGRWVREVGVVGGIAHAFNGSLVQAERFLGLGLHLGFGGVLTFERARQVRRLAVGLPLSALVLETDAPDMPPAWVAVSAAERAAGVGVGVNCSCHLPRIGAVLAELRGVSVGVLAQALWENSVRALPRLARGVLLHPCGVVGGVGLSGWVDSVGSVGGGC